MEAILCIETSTDVCSAAVVTSDGTVLAERISTEGRDHSARLGVFIDEIVSETERTHCKIAAVAVSSGPGSYTGLRIGVSMAKGLSFGYRIPLIAVDTLTLMAHQFLKNHPNTTGLLCPMLDARRMEVYTAIYDSGLNQIQPVSATVVTGTEFDELLNTQPITFFGNGSDKCREAIAHSNAKFIADIVPLARFLAEPAFEKLVANKTENVAYFEPYYLKDFVAIPSRIKGLR